ncbi:MAG TPA: sarcosine oxidase subunit delta [Alphaproteobacteria bacterium]|nr:sarcosine oxidase subunit delta [Alphaproteobacteria bacterium]
MMLIPCPWCGPRPECEFEYGADATVQRPEDPSSVTDDEWTEYLYFRDNPKGWHKELWFHRTGCHHWFVTERHTVTHEIAAAYPPSDPPLPAAVTDEEGPE